MTQLASLWRQFCLWRWPTGKVKVTLLTEELPTSIRPRGLGALENTQSRELKVLFSYSLPALRDTAQVISDIRAPCDPTRDVLRTTCIDGV